MCCTVCVATVQDMYVPTHLFMMALCAHCLPQAPVVLTTMTFVLGGIQQLSMQQLSEVSLIRTSLPVPSLSLPMVSGPLSVHSAVHTLCIGIGRSLFGQGSSLRA